MPTYEYITSDKGCDHCSSRFDIQQKMSDDALKVCPECENAVKRVFSAFAVTGKERQLLSSKNLAEKGFTEYRKAGNGCYEKTAGDGPNLIHR